MDYEKQCEVNMGEKKNKKHMRRKEIRQGRECEAEGRECERRNRILI